MILPLSQSATGLKWAMAGLAAGGSLLRCLISRGTLAGADFTEKQTLTLSEVLANPPFVGTLLWQGTLTGEMLQIFDSHPGETHAFGKFWAFLPCRQKLELLVENFSILLAKVMFFVAPGGLLALLLDDGGDSSGGLRFQIKSCISGQTVFSWEVPKNELGPHSMASGLHTSWSHPSLHCQSCLICKASRAGRNFHLVIMEALQLMDLRRL